MSSVLPATGIRFPVEPRDVPPAKAARRLHLTQHDFELALPRLLVRSFPHPDPDTGYFDLKAIDAWMDRRSGLVNVAEAQDAEVGFGDRLGAIRGGRGRQR